MMKIGTLDRKVDNLNKRAEIVVGSVLKEVFGVEEGGANDPSHDELGAFPPELIVHMEIQQEVEHQELEVEGQLGEEGVKYMEDVVQHVVEGDE